MNKVQRHSQKKIQPTNCRQLTTCVWRIDNFGGELQKDLVWNAPFTTLSLIPHATEAFKSVIFFLLRGQPGIKQHYGAT